MKKPTKSERKLVLHRDVVRQLDAEELANVGGGNSNRNLHNNNYVSCPIPD